MSKILDSIITLKEDMEGNWKRELDRIGVWHDIAWLYDQGYSRIYCNRVLAFVVMAYDRESGWIELHKDRNSDREKIMKRLGGDLKDEDIRRVLACEDPDCESLVRWFVEWQQDWRWDSILTCFQYHANMMRFASSQPVPEPYTVDEDRDDEDDLPSVGPGSKRSRRAKKDKKPMPLSDDKMAGFNLKKGDAIEKAINERQRGEALLKEIQKEFVVLDTVLDKEGRRKATDMKDILSHENFIGRLRGRTGDE